MGLWFNITLACFAATGSFLFGYDSGVMTDVIQSPHFLKFFNTTKTSPTIGAINSTFSGGAVFGSLMGGLTMDRLGRRLTIMIGAAIALLGSILQSAAQNLAMVLVGRILAGWAVGLLSMSVPVYQAECAHPKHRGFIVGLAQQMIGVGYIVSTWIGYGSSKVPRTSSFSWRFPLAFQALPCVILIGGIMFFPESPRHLIEHDQEDEALRVLRKLHYNGQNDEWIQQEFREIRVTVAAEKAITAPGWRVMFTVPQWRTRLMHATLAQVFTQFTGINVINYYQTIMYESLGITGDTNLLVTGIYNCVGPITNFIFITLILDRVGRKKASLPSISMLSQTNETKPLLFGTVGITLALVCEAIVNSQNTDAHSRGLSIAGVFFYFLVTVMFSLSFGSISWVYASEIMPMQIRARGSAFATGIGNWLVATVWNQVSPQGLEHIGWKFYFVFICWNVCITFPTILFWFKETKALSLEEIDLLFGERALGSLPESIADAKGPVEEVVPVGAEEHELAKRA